MPILKWGDTYRCLHGFCFLYLLLHPACSVSLGGSPATSTGSDRLWSLCQLHVPYLCQPTEDSHIWRRLCGTHSEELTTLTSWSRLCHHPSGDTGLWEPSWRDYSMSWNCLTFPWCWAGSASYDTTCRLIESKGLLPSGALAVTFPASTPVLPIEEAPFDLSNVPSLYKVFTKSWASSLPLHCSYSCIIDLLPSTTLPFCLHQKQTMEKYISKSLASGLIYPLSSPTRAGFFFVEAWITSSLRIATRSHSSPKHSPLSKAASSLKNFTYTMLTNWSISKRGMSGRSHSTLQVVIMSTWLCHLGCPMLRLSSMQWSTRSWGTGTSDLSLCTWTTSWFSSPHLKSTCSTSNYSFSTCWKTR